MFENVFDKPSFYAHIFTCIALLAALLLLFFNYRNITLSLYQKLVLLLLIAIVVGIHGLSHHMLEIYYQFNPMKDLFF